MFSGPKGPLNALLYFEATSMSIYQTVKRTVLVTSCLLLAIAVSGFWYLNSSLEEACSKTLEIAQDQSKVEYLDAWATNNILDKGYHFVTGMHGQIRGSINDEHQQITVLPSFEKSGIKNKYFRFNVEKRTGNFKTKITSKNVGRFEFGNGRNQIIVLKNGTKLVSYSGYNHTSGHLVQVSENVFAYCADSTFEI